MKQQPTGEGNPALVDGSGELQQRGGVEVGVGADDEESSVGVQSRVAQVGQRSVRHRSRHVIRCARFCASDETLLF